jgi:hypothetical protein
MEDSDGNRGSRYLEETDVLGQLFLLTGTLWKVIKGVPL